MGPDVADRIDRGDTSLLKCVKNGRMVTQKEGHPDACGGSGGLALSQKEGGVTCALSHLHCSVGIREANPVVRRIRQEVSA